MEILRGAEESILPKQKRLFEILGVELEFTGQALCPVAVEACGLGTGARTTHIMSVLHYLDYMISKQEFERDGAQK